MIEVHFWFTSTAQLNFLSPNSATSCPNTKVGGVQKCYNNLEHFMVTLLILARKTFQFLESHFFIVKFYTMKS